MIECPPDHSNLVDPERCEICPVCNGVGYVPRKENIDFHRAVKTENQMKLSELSTKELLAKAWEEISALCGSTGPHKHWSMSVPVDDDRDSDVLFGEVLKRLAQLEAEVERLQKLADDYQSCQDHCPL